MKFIPTSDKVDLYHAILISFSDDDKLINEYHCISGTVYECVNDTYFKIVEGGKDYPMDWYVVEQDDNVIGYCVICKTYSFLYSFGINIRYRTSENVIEWFDIVKSYLGENFFCGLWAKNKRAINFLIRNGMSIYEKNDSEVFLKYN